MSQSQGSGNTTERKGFEVQYDINLSQIEKSLSGDYMVLSHSDRDLANNTKDVNLSQTGKDLPGSQQNFNLSQICSGVTNSQKDFNLSQIGKDLHNSQKDINQSQMCRNLSNSPKNVNLSQSGRDLTNNQKDVDKQMTEVIVIEEELDIKKENDFSDNSDDTSCTLMSACLPDVITRQQINHIDCLRMRNSLTEILEEVKLRRNNDVENEERIRHLVQEKHELERKLDGEQLRFVSLQEDQEKKSAEIKHQFEDKIKVLQAEVKQNQVFRDCVEKETKALKDDIRNLQMTNYNLEKKLREQGTKLQLQVTSANQHLNQLSSTEDKFKAVSTYCKKLSESLDRLKKNVKEAVKLNKDLMYTNEHQKCIIDEQKGEISLLQGHLLDMKVKLDSKPLDTSKIEQEEEITALKEQLQNEKDEHSEIIEELNRTSCNYKETLVKLQDSYDLIERHLQNAESHQREATTLSTELEGCKDKMNKLKIALDSLNKELNIEKSVHHQSVETWKKQEEELRLKLISMSEDLEKEKSAKMDLEHLNTVWSEQNIRLSEELTEVKAILNVPKEDGLYQTELSMLNMANTGCQVQPELSTFGSQTEHVRRYSISSQTEPPPCSDAVCQTFAPALAVSATQTKEPPLVNRGAQTEKMADDLLIEKHQNTPVRYHTAEVQTETVFDWTGCKPINSEESGISLHEKECKDINGRKEHAKRDDINDCQSSVSCTVTKNNQSKLKGQNSNFETCQSTISREKKDDQTDNSSISDLSTFSTIVQSKLKDVSFVTTEHDAIREPVSARGDNSNKVDVENALREPVSARGDNSNEVDVEIEKTVTGKAMFSLSKDFVKAYNTDEETAHKFSKSFGKNHGGKIEKDEESISTSSNLSENLEAMKNKGKCVRELGTHSKKKETDVNINEEQGDRSEEKNKLVEKPRKLSLYESQLDGYLSKIISGNMKQNTVCVKLIKPRDDQDALKSRKYVEYLQPVEKSDKYKDPVAMSKSKVSSPSGRGSLSLGKKRFKSSCTNEDNIESRFDSKNGKLPENRPSCSGQLQNSSANFENVSTRTLRSKYILPDTESSIYKSYLPSDRPEKSDLSPYSSSRTLLKTKTGAATEKTVNIERSIKQKDNKKGILKDFVIEVPSEKDRKNVTFSEQMVHVKHMSPDLELSGDQSLFSDDEDLEIEIIESQEDCTVEKRPRLD